MSTELVPLTKRQQTIIVNNVLESCKDITKLNKQGYNFLYLCSGFIAHYDQFGFIDHYIRASLEADILYFARENQWANFRKGDRDYEYYMTRKDVYNRIVHSLNARYKTIKNYSFK